MSSIQLVALDLDGTLVDSAPDLAHCLGHSLDTVGFRRPSLVDARGWIGDGVEVLIRRALLAAGNESPDAALVANALSAFKRCYRDHLFVASKLYDGVDKTLGELSAAGLKLGCATNKPAGFAVDLLDQARIGHYFEFIHGADSFSNRKPHPEMLTRAAERFGIDPGHAVMVGDSKNDRNCARAAGFGFVFAAYGYAPPDDPELISEPSRIESFSDLGRLLCG